MENFNKKAKNGKRLKFYRIKCEKNNSIIMREKLIAIFMLC